MNKKIIGISVAMLFAASGAIAQTSVTMYGTVDAGVAYQNGAFSAGKKITLESGQQSYSRIGFKGTEDLGNGMKALFVLEQGVQIDTGTSGYDTLGSGILTTDPYSSATPATSINSGTFSSQAYVGVSSNAAGTVTFGRQFSPLYESYLAIDPFMNGFAAGMNNFFGNIGNASLYQRMDNAIIYHTPDNLYGFKGALAYGFGEQAGHTKSQSQIGVSLGYANGPVTVAYAFHDANNDLNGYDAFKTHFIGATWDFGVAKAHVAFDQNKLGSIFKTQDYMVGVTVPVGANSVFADYTHKKDKINASSNANQFAIGYTYNLSKRTNLYTAYSYIKNETAGRIDNDAPGKNVSTFQLGMRHMF